MKQFDIIYDFGVLEVIRKSWFLVIPLLLYWLATNRLRNKENGEANLIQNLLTQGKSFDATNAQIVKYASIIFFIFLLTLQTVKIYRTYSFLNNGLKSIEGYVTDFHGMPSSGHDTERFKVKNVKFEFSDFELTDFGYNNAKSKGGEIDENVYIRLKYYQTKDRNVILKLEKRK
jgi:preprotein translocase subunit SecF